MNSHRRCAAFERLESRHLMAGNITAVMTGRDLLIEGDDFANTLSVSQTAAEQHRPARTRPRRVHCANQNQRRRYLAVRCHVRECHRQHHRSHARRR